MGFGKYVLEVDVGAIITERYGISFREFTRRRYHLMSDDEIRRDIEERGTKV